MDNPNILSEIARNIDDHRTFYNFMIAVLNRISNKDKILKEKRKQFLIEHTGEDEKEWNGCSIKYYTLPNGKKEGLFQEFYHNGRLQQSWELYDGKKEGLYQYWSLTGDLVAKSSYHNNKLHGEHYEWDSENKKLVLEGFYINGVNQN